MVDRKESSPSGAARSQSNCVSRLGQAYQEVDEEAHLFRRKKTPSRWETSRIGPDAMHSLVFERSSLLSSFLRWPFPSGDPSLLAESDIVW